MAWVCQLLKKFAVAIIDGVGHPAGGTTLLASLQVTKYVQREILNHRRLIHPHIVEMREVRRPVATLAPCLAPYGVAPNRGTPRKQAWQHCSGH